MIDLPVSSSRLAVQRRACRLFLSFCGLLFLGPGCASSPARLPSDKDLARELIARVGEDQRLNQLVVDGDPRSREAGFEEERGDLFRENTRRAVEIFDELGYPTRVRFGEEASDAFWLIVQHSDEDLGFQERVALAMRPLAIRGEVRGDALAMLLDRVRVNSERPQVYGSQVRYERDTGRAFPKDLEDPRSVDARRARVGLEPLWKYMNDMSELQFMMNEEIYRDLGVNRPWSYPEGFSDW